MAWPPQRKRESLTESIPAWSVVLDAARGLTARGHRTFTRRELLAEVAALDPGRLVASLGPVLQGMTANAPGGVPNPLGQPFHRVSRGVYSLAGDLPVLSSPPLASSADREPTTSRSISPRADAGDVLLVGCVKTKRNQPAVARDLFTSPLFGRRSAYAESREVPWFILSSKHALVEPGELLAPYDMYLADQSAAYRTAWGAWVVERLAALIGPLAGRAVEVHAGAAYLDPLRQPLASHGAEVVAPLAGLAMGEQLGWYDRQAPADGSARTNSSAVTGCPPTGGSDAAEVLQRLLDEKEALSPTAVAATRRAEWQAPGLCSWWVDRAGAADLTAGLGESLESVLIYVGGLARAAPRRAAHPRRHQRAAAAGVGRPLPGRARDVLAPVR